MKFKLAAALVATALSGCATTDIQPLTQSSFMIATTAAPACGPTGARKVANQAAAIEVIKRGGDRFVFANSEQDNFTSGGGYYGNVYGSYTSHQQSLIVQMVSKGQTGYSDSLSARALLGSEWQSIVAEGTPDTCT